MAARKKSEAEQRFVALEVDEVSLVDDPANEEKFIVVKRKEQTTMSKKTTDTPTDKTGETGDENTAPENGGESTSGASEALGEARALMSELKPVLKALEEAGITLDDETDEGGDDDGDSAANDEPEEVKVAKADFKKLKRLVAKLEKVSTDIGEQISPTKKGDTEDAPTKKARVIKDEDGNEGLFVPADLKVAKSLGEALAGFIEKEEERAKPKSDQEVQAAAIGTALATALAPVSKSLKSITDRLETLETTRQSSNAAGDSDETTTNVKKGKSGIWDGSLTGFSAKK